MKCKDCARYPFCSHIHKPTDEACENKIKRQLDDTDYIISREEGMRHNENVWPV